MKQRRVFDSDGHVFEDPAGMYKHMPPVYRAWKDSHGVFKNAQWFPGLGHLHTPTGQHPPGGFGGGRFIGETEWSAFLEATGIAGTALYPTMGLTYGLMAQVDYAIATCAAYNNWLHEAYVQRSPRFKGMALIPLQEPAAAVDELYRVVEKLGFAGAMLPTNGLKAPLGSKEYWSIFEAADKLGCALAVHGGSHINFGMDKINVFAVAHAIGHPLGMMINLGSLVFNRVFERYPRVRIAFLESGTAWLLLCLERFDGSYKNFQPLDHRGEILVLKDRKPSEYIVDLIKADRIYLGCEGDELMIVETMKLVGNRPFLYSSDFTHEVNADTCNEHIAEVYASNKLTQDDKDAILWRNAERFYRVSVPAT